MRFPKRRKKRLRWRRLMLPFLTMVTVITIISLYRPDASNQTSVIRTLQSSKAEDPIESLRLDETKYTVTKKNGYVCGEETIVLGEWTGRQIAEKLEQEPDWKLWKAADQQVTLSEEIEDLSPSCKESAYFGLDRDGNLSLFEGLPEQNRVLRTFFQIDIEYLKSSLPHETVDQLYNGIKITEYEDYNSVISTFADYAIGRPAL